MYFDVNTYEHAHFYDMNTNMHVDFTDPELIKLVTDYVNAKGLGNFKLSTVDIQLIGEMN